MAERARRGEAEGSGLHRLARERAHLGDVRGGGLLVLGAALPHHISAQRSVRQLYRDVDGPLAPVEHIEELRKRLPAPLHAFVQCGARDVLHSLHQLDEPALSAGPHRREADTAVARHDGGHAVRRRRLEHVVPGGLAVVVRVRIDEARRDDATRCVEGLTRRLEVERGAISTMRPSRIATSARYVGPPVPSTMLPPWITRSCMRTLPTGTMLRRWGRQPGPERPRPELRMQ